MCDRTNKTNKNIYKELLKNKNKLYDVVFDVVVGDLTEHLLELLKNNGNYVCSGAIGGREKYSRIFLFETFKFIWHVMYCSQFEELLQLVFSNQINL